MAIRMLEEGHEDFVVLECAREVGGTWRENTYPGLKCDVPSHLYSLSFAPNSHWSRMYPSQPEILRYLKRIARERGVLEHVRFGCELEQASWDHTDRRWAIRTSDGELTADVLITGVGTLADPRVPALPGLEEFEGAVFHAARWDHDHDLTGRRAAVIGSGASAVQFVPEIQPHVAQLDIYQRTPNWILPHPDRPYTALERFAFRHIPGYRRATRELIFRLHELGPLMFVRDPRLTAIPEAICRAHLHAQVRTSELRAKLTPDYKFGCKRILLSNGWYPALQRPNVELITDPIRRITATGIITADGVERAADTVILATGYRFAYRERLGARVRGRGGRTLLDAGQSAYRGTTINGFPNLFVLIGPNCGLGHNSLVEIIEAQIAYVLDALRVMDARGIASIEVTPEAQTAHNRDLQHRLATTVWNSGGCASWYLDDDGINRTLFPGSLGQFRQGVRRFDTKPFHVVSRSANGVPRSGYTETPS
jgi:cation diffusion facilitator CzcD-associated flavoprotein CzcO